MRTKKFSIAFYAALTVIRTYHRNKWLIIERKFSVIANVISLYLKVPVNYLFVKLITFKDVIIIFSVNILLNKFSPLILNFAKFYGKTLLFVNEYSKIALLHLKIATDNETKD